MVSKLTATTARTSTRTIRRLSALAIIGLVALNLYNRASYLAWFLGETTAATKNEESSSIPTRMTLENGAIDNNNDIIVIEPEIAVAFGLLMGRTTATARRNEVVASTSTDLIPVALPTTQVNCFDHNSDSWLKSPRIGNTPKALGKDQTEKDLQQFILASPNVLKTTGNWRKATQPTLAHKQSTFRKGGGETDHSRRIFAAIHYHQHKHAIPEAQARLKGNQDCTQQLHRHNISVFDYECPNAQHLVIHMGGPGLGANVRGGINSALVLGLANDRVVHVITNKPHTHKHIWPWPERSPFRAWEHASCDRRDYQCVFQPLTPCVLTEEDLEQAHVLNQTEYGNLRSSKTGKLPDYLNDAKVIIYQNNFRALDNLPKAAEEAVQNYVSTVLDPKAPLIDFAPKQERSVALPIPTTNMDHRLQQVTTVYSLRMLPYVRQQVSQTVASLGKPLFQADPTQTIGLPIRASDKCGMESECLTYKEHLQAATDFWNQHSNHTTSSEVSMIVTTESLEIRKEHQQFTTNTNHPQFNYKFLSNSFEESLPGMGNANPFKTPQPQKHNITFMDADTSMIGSLASLHLQMHASLHVANVCSNYHQMIQDLAQSGCSAAGSSAKFFFLQESENPWFRVCCWLKNSKGKGCKAKREKFWPGMNDNEIK